MLFRFSLAITTLFVISCVSTHYSNGLLKTRDTQYQIAEPKDTWKAISIKGIDRAWMNADKATLMINSSCHESSDPSLIALTGHLLIGMTDQQIIEQKTIPSSGREALESTVSVKIDGVERQMKIFVLKKDKCIYDIVLASPKSTFDIAVSDFDTLIASFNAGTAS